MYKTIEEALKEANHKLSELDSFRTQTEVINILKETFNGIAVNYITGRTCIFINNDFFDVRCKRKNSSYGLMYDKFVVTLKDEDTKMTDTLEMVKRDIRERKERVEVRRKERKDKQLTDFKKILDDIGISTNTFIKAYDTFNNMDYSVKTEFINENKE